MAILCDFSHTVVSSIMATVAQDKKVDLNEDLIRHYVLNVLRSYKTKYHAAYGKLILCMDSKHSWRKEVFPLYKAARKKNREGSSFDWDGLYTNLNQLAEDLKNFFPYPVIKVDRAEGDDIIAVLAEYFSQRDQPTLIISGDKDFQQLQKYKLVRQYRPVQKDFAKCPDPAAFLKEHIMLGDVGDGIPNFLSDDDTFVTEGKRQKPISKTKLAEWVRCAEPTNPLNGFTETQLRGYHRNRQLIDFTYIPEEIKTQILDTYNNVKTGNIALVRKYFIEHRCRQLLENLDQF